jgi:hypothetical protein
MQIPLVSIAQAHRSQTLVLPASRLFEQLGTVFRDVILRDPPVQDPTRWHDHAIEPCIFKSRV